MVSFKLVNTINEDAHTQKRCGSILQSLKGILEFDVRERVVIGNGNSVGIQGWKYSGYEIVILSEYAV
jgi:hypothetical protein